MNRPLVLDGAAAGRLPASFLDARPDDRRAAPTPAEGPTPAAAELERARLRALLDCAVDLIAVVDAAGVIRYATQSSAQVLGYPADHFIGRSGFALDLVHPDDIGRARESFGRLLAGITRFEADTVRCRHLDGTWRWMQVTATHHLDNPAVNGVVLDFRDVTEQRKARDAAQERDELYRATFDQAPVGIAHATLDGRFTQVNAQYARMLGYTPEEVLARSLSFVTPPEDLLADQEAFQQLIAGTIKTHNRQKRYVHKDGRIIWGSRTVSLRRDAAGKPLYLIAVVEDITERKAMEQQLLHAQKMDAFGQLAGGVAHDFNNLLAVLLIHLNLMSADPGLPARTVATLKQLEEATNRATSLVRQLLIFSRRQDISRQVLDLNESVDGMCKMLRRFIGENIAFRFTPSLTPVWVSADPGMLEQVVMNLCVNARDAMPDGGSLSVSIRRERRWHPERPHLPPADYASLVVTDSGHGMDEATRKRIFEPFFTTKPAGRGTGLGLATVQGVAAQHDGWVEVDSAPGVGSTFRVFVPTHAPAIAADAQRTANLACGSERVLLVEDEAAVRATAAACLRHLGYRVTEAANGPEALARWYEAEAPFDLVLTDMIMPGGMSGADLANELQRLRPELKVVVMSGYNPEPCRTERAGCRPWTRLPKPFTAVGLLQYVRAVIDDQPAPATSAP